MGTKIPAVYPPIQMDTLHQSADKRKAGQVEGRYVFSTGRENDGA